MSTTKFQKVRIDSNRATYRVGPKEWPPLVICLFSKQVSFNFSAVFVEKSKKTKKVTKKKHMRNIKHIKNTVESKKKHPD